MMHHTYKFVEGYIDDTELLLRRFAIWYFVSFALPLYAYTPNTFTKLRLIRVVRTFLARPILLLYLYNSIHTALSAAQRTLRIKTQMPFLQQKTHYLYCLCTRLSLLFWVENVYNVRILYYLHHTYNILSKMHYPHPSSLTAV